MPTYAWFSLALLQRSRSLHQDWFNNKFNCSELKIPTPCRANTIISREILNVFLRKVSLTARLNLFRPTADGTFFLPTTKPNLEFCLPFSIAKTNKSGLETLKLLFLKTCWKSEELRRRSSLVNLQSGTKPLPYAERRFRPLARRRFKTALPPAVAILALKPCVLFLFKLLGWNVLFMAPDPKVIRVEVHKAGDFNEIPTAIQWFVVK